MADTLPDIKLTKDVPTDLYAASGIDPSVAIKIVNKGGTTVSLFAGTDPTAIDGSEPLLPYERLQNVAADTGAWATSHDIDGLVNVGVA